MARLCANKPSGPTVAELRTRALHPNMTAHLNAIGTAVPIALRWAVMFGCNARVRNSATVGPEGLLAHRRAIFVPLREP